MRYTIVIGTGISATAWLASLRGRDHVTVMGGSHLWQQMDPQHQMGQPAPLLTGNLLPGPRRLLPQDRGTFMLSRDFARIVDATLRHHHHARIPSSLVTRILPVQIADYRYVVEVAVQGVPYRFLCHNVVVALGPGPSRALTVKRGGEDEDVNVGAMQGRVVGGTEFLSPTWRMPGGGTGENRTVAVYGGSATASWAVEQAEIRGMVVRSWFTRPGSGASAWDAGARFRDAFPAGNRNQGVQQRFANIREVRKLVRVQLLEPMVGTPCIAITFEGQDGETRVEIVDLLVYALGADHLGEGGIREMIGGDLHNRLVAFYDRNQVISVSRSLLAIGTPDRSLMIVGSALSSRAGFGGDGPDLTLQNGDPGSLNGLGSYASIAETLPQAARPAEGIAMVMAGVEALNEFIPARQVGNASAMFSNNHGQDVLHPINFQWDINFNTSNRTQLAAWVAQTTDLDPFAANVAVALLVRLRSSARNTFGLTDPQVQTVLDFAGAAAAETRRLNPGENESLLDRSRRSVDRDATRGTDVYIDAWVNHMTTDAQWVQTWARAGITC